MTLDFLGTTASLLATILFVRLDTKAWAVSFIAISINGYLYFIQGIYADAGLEVVYLLTTSYGWVRWNRLPTGDNTEIRILSAQQWVWVAMAVTVLYLCIVSLLRHYTYSTIARLDALTASLSLVAQTLMCFKASGSWILWLVTDVIYGYLYHVKHLPFHVVLMVVYIGLAISGYWLWLQKHATALSRFQS